MQNPKFLCAALPSKASWSQQVQMQVSLDELFWCWNISERDKEGPDQVLAQMQETAAKRTWQRDWANGMSVAS